MDGTAAGRADELEVMERDETGWDESGLWRMSQLLFFAVKTIINPLAHPTTYLVGTTRIQGGWACWAAGGWWTGGGGGRSDSKVGGGLTRRKSGEQ